VSERVDTAMTALRGKLAELEVVVRSSGETDWRRGTGAERWPVGLVAFHIARGFQRQAEFIEAARDQLGPHMFSWDETNDLNAMIATANPSPSRDEVIALARSSVDRMDAALRAMDEDALARVAFVNEGRERDTVWVAGRLATEHARGHLESIAATVAKG
jgi:hypothetical protein